METYLRGSSIADVTALSVESPFWRIIHYILSHRKACDWNLLWSNTSCLTRTFLKGSNIFKPMSTVRTWEKTFKENWRVHQHFLVGYLFFVSLSSQVRMVMVKCFRNKFRPNSVSTVFRTARARISYNSQYRCKRFCLRSWCKILQNAETIWVWKYGNTG